MGYDPQMEIPLEVGSLPAEVVRLMLDELPLDLTFVDAQRRVRYYSGKYRIFSRTPEIIGTDVVECHSPASQGRVARLLSELESGWRDDAEFLEMHDGRPVHVRYAALRDGEGEYLGTLEVVRWLEEGAEAIGR